MCDPEEERKQKEKLGRRSLFVKALLGFALAVLGFLAVAIQRLRPTHVTPGTTPVVTPGTTPVKGGPYAPPPSDKEYVFADVSGLWNYVGIATSSYRFLANFDEDGRAFPQDACPPSFGPNLAVVSCPNDGVRFVFPDETDRVMNVVKCQSQRMEVPPGRYSKVHVLGASIRGSTGGVTGYLEYQSGKRFEFELYLEPWRNASKGGDIVVHAQKIYLADGSELTGPDAHAYLCHSQVPCDPAEVLQKLILPSGCHCNDHESCACKISDIRVLAITLEP